MPASASTSPSLGRITATPPRRPASAETAVAWMSGSIVVRTAWPRSGWTEASSRSPASRRPPAVPGELGVELALEPGQADGRAVGDAAALELGGALGRRGADAPGDLRRDRAEVGEPVLALGQRRAVAGQDRGARRQLGVAGELLAAAQAGLDERALPFDRRAVVLLGDGQREPAAEVAEDPRAQRDGDRDRPVDRLWSLAGAHAVERARRRRLAVGGGEVLEREALLRAGREQGVHRLVVAAAPGVGELLGDLLARVRPTCADGDPDPEGDHRGERQRGEPGRQPTTPVGAAARWGRGGGAGSGACGRGHARRTL